MTQYYSFTSASVSQVPQVVGVYKLAQPATKPGLVDVIYVGRSDNLRKRLFEHLNTDDRCIGQATDFAYETTSTPIAREAELIGYYKSRCNELLK